jgi:hypothetical protein
MSHASKQPKASPGLLPDRFITPAVAAEFLSVSSATLAWWRCQGCGPEYRKLGSGRSAAIRYSLEALRRFMDDPAPAMPAKRPFRPAVGRKGQPSVSVARARKRRNGGVPKT